MRRFGRAVLGGTFDRLHIGHEALLETAFRVGRTVAIGLTSARYLADHPKPDRAPLQSYATRRRNLVAWLRRRHPGAEWTVVPLHDRLGGSVARGVGVLVVSADTSQGGKAVNAERRRRGLPPVRIERVPLALADDLRPVASRRIRAGTIDRRGRRHAPIRVELTASDPSDARTATRAIRVAFPRSVVVAPTTRTRPEPRAPGRNPAVPPPPVELWVGVDRSPAGGWRVVVRSPYVRLDPVRIPGTRPSELARGLRRVLRPSSRGPPRESF
ncbi:MAG TPA: pantetheine-phosphate adenylyltransferase [Thermoplasmata archaeon]|nr:pantetheine-phosphate adenylyltransferase [Thermoplasmata archaeon]